METSFIDNNSIGSSKSNSKNNKKSIKSDLEYYSIFTPSILHDALIARIIDSYINDNDNDNNTSITTVSDTTHNTSLIDSNIRPFSHSLEGVLVCVDISQFTKLSVTLEIEQVEHVINQIFGTLTTIVYCFGGDIIKFAGDAFYAFWKIEDESQRTDVSMMTVECCVQLREVFKKEILTNYDSIDIRICSEAGKLTFFNVGAGKRYEYLFYGQPLTDTIKADKLTVKGDYVICSSLYSHVKENLAASNFELDSIGNDNITCYKFPKDSTDLFNSILSDEDVQDLLSVKRDSLLQSKIFDELSSKGCKSIEKDYLKIEMKLSKQLSFFVHEFARNSAKDKELKNSCILFCRIVSDIDKLNESEMANNLQNYIACILSIVGEFEAKLRQYIIDDKGLVVIISVNSSRTSWLKNCSVALMAISTAISIQKELRRKHSLDTVIGITEGKCYFGAIGWLDSRVEYSIMGPNVNLSARLMSAGVTGDIICDSNVYKSAFSKKNSFGFEKQSDLVLKGFSEPVENYKIIARELLPDETISSNDSFLEANKELSSGLIISKQGIVQIAEFMFKPSMNTQCEDDVAIYFANLLDYINFSATFFPKFCFIEDREGLSNTLDSLFEIISNVISPEQRLVKLIKTSCAVHDNVFTVIIKKYIDLWISKELKILPSSSPAKLLSDLKMVLDLSDVSSEMIDSIQTSFVSLSAQQQVICMVEIFEKISTVFGDFLIIFIDQGQHLDSISYDTFTALSSRQLKIQFVLSHDLSNEADRLFLFVKSSLKEDCCLQISTNVCTYNDVERYLITRFEANGLSIPVTDTVVDLISCSTKQNPSLMIQLIESCVQSYMQRELEAKEDSTVASSLSFEQEVTEYTRLDDLTYYKYDILTLKSQKVCKLAAVLSIKDVFNLRTLYEIILLFFSELLDFKTGPGLITKIDFNEAKNISLNNLQSQLLASNFFKISEVDINGEDIYLKFNITREKEVLYSFIPLDLKKQYHTYAAKAFAGIVNGAASKPQPSWVQKLGYHFYKAGDLQGALICNHYYGEYLYSIGSNKDGAVVFERVFDITRELFRDVLNKSLEISVLPSDMKTSESLSTLSNFEENLNMFAVHDMHEIFEVCNGSNDTLYACISSLIRFGQCLLNTNRKKEAMVVYPVAIQLFVSAKKKSRDNTDELICKSPLDLNFLGSSEFLIKESNINFQRRLMNQLPLFGIFDDQYENILPSLSGYLCVSCESGHHNQKIGNASNWETWDMNLKTIDNIITTCKAKQIKTFHYLRFANLKVWYGCAINDLKIVDSSLSVAEETYKVYKFDEHSNKIITLYGADRGLESIAFGAFYNVLAGNFGTAFQYIDFVNSTIPKLTHFFSFLIGTQKLGLALILMGDFKSALGLYQKLRKREINTAYSLFINVNIFILEWLIQAVDNDSEENNDPDDEKMRITSSIFDAICNGTLERSAVLPFEFGYRLSELNGVGFENVLAGICLAKALKVMKTISSEELSNGSREVERGRIISLCNTGLQYLRSYIIDDDDEDLASGYMIIRIQSLWCQATLCNLLLRVTIDIDKQEVHKQRAKKSLETVDEIIKIFFAGFDDSYVKLVNEYLKVRLLNDNDINRHAYIIERYDSILKDIEHAERSYESTSSSSSSSILQIIQRFKEHINELLSQI